MKERPTIPEAKDIGEEIFALILYRKVSFKQMMEAIKLSIIKASLRANDKNRSAACEAMQLGRQSMYNILQRDAKPPLNVARGRPVGTYPKTFSDGPDLT